MGIAVQKIEGNEPRKSNGIGVNVAKHIESLCQTRDDIAQKIKDLTEEKKAYEEAIKTALKAPQKGTFGEYSISWIETETRRVDTKTLKARYPDIAEDCTVVSSGDRLTITKKK